MYIAYVQPWSSHAQDAFFGSQKVDLTELRAALFERSESGTNERDQELLSCQPPTVGHPNLLADPFFQNWLWGFDARRAVDEVRLADNLQTKE
ncbi:hypothetical protein F4678DRAFT_456216 [Xylaria arbuscula]|nr:hypothetical protein F4678DRAFT_456216 [Xylaria arbuscula]